MLRILTKPAFCYMCVLIQLHMCPHFATYLSSFCYICVLILLQMCPHTATYVFSYYMRVLIWYICVLILLHLCPHSSTCVLILLYMCPHTAIYVSSYCYTCVLIYCCVFVAQAQQASSRSEPSLFHTVWLSLNATHVFNIMPTQEVLNLLAVVQK